MLSPIQAALSSGDRVPGQDVLQLVIVDGDVSDIAAPVQLMTGTSKPVVNNSATFADLAAATAAHNALLAALRTRGVIGGS